MKLYFYMCESICFYSIVWHSNQRTFSVLTIYRIKCAGVIFWVIVAFGQKATMGQLWIVFREIHDKTLAAVGLFTCLLVCDTVTSKNRTLSITWPGEVPCHVTLTATLCNLKTSYLHHLFKVTGIPLCFTG